MSKTEPPLLAVAKKLSAMPDVRKVAGEVGLPVPPKDAQGLLWLALAVHRAGLGLPPDPLRARGWIRFGRPLEEKEKLKPGDVGVGGGAAGIITPAGDERITLRVGPDETVNIDADVMTVRRPIVPQPDGGNR